MNISAINPYSNPNFGITSKVRIKRKDGTTALLNVTGEVLKNRNIKITKITGEIMSKGKSIGKTNEYVDKKGFDAQRFAEISEELARDAKEPDTVMDKLFDAICRPNSDYNA